MRALIFGSIFALCCVSAISENQITPSTQANVDAIANNHMKTATDVIPAEATSFGAWPRHLRKRKLDVEDPANPVAAAATDPNEAAMKIKSRDLINTDRQDIRPDPHPHHHVKPHGESHQDNEEDQQNGDNEDDSGNSKPKNTSKPKDKKKSLKKSKDEDEGKKNKGKEADKKSKGGKKNKNTHTGLDGKEVEDEESEGNEEHNKKKTKVKHVQAKKRRWRTGKPKYNYNKALQGWKDVGPLYYYKGKYENAAGSVRLHGTENYVKMLLPSVLAIASSVLVFLS